MGIGAGLVPGGNDGLILFGGQVPAIRCTGDTCRADL
jgi:hypothetical protein